MITDTTITLGWSKRLWWGSLTDRTVSYYKLPQHVRRAVFLSGLLHYALYLQCVLEADDTIVSPCIPFNLIFPNAVGITE